MAELDDAPLVFGAARSYGYTHGFVLDRVHDGDTLIGGVRHWPDIVGDQIEVRLFGVDAPEIRDPRPDIKALADRAKARLEQLLRSGPIVLVDMMRDKYFRILAKVKVGAADVAEVLVQEGLARHYTGQGPKPW